MRNLALLAAVAVLTGCSGAPKSETFTFTADLPPNFAYTATVNYVPGAGQTCTVPRKDNLKPVFNRKWRERYQPDAEIEIRRVRNGCELVVHSVELDINASYGDDSGDIGVAKATVAIRETLDDLHKSSFDAEGKRSFSGQCQWMFRTTGPSRRIVKILDCKSITAHGDLIRSRPFAAIELNQLSGKTISLKINLATEEKPYYKGWWVQTDLGWRPCTGRWGTTNEERCIDPPQFTDFKMPNGQTCTVYPNCQERGDTNVD
ncbi:lipoprotein [Pseudomonas sp. M47T1]|uniref:hypothetical protein n=1 Tax=Pseudomonas sp. M47T1 TaxID=1179778 RepID=UPI0002607AEB|nr:hypothetical protein [Pseudomonas sp. M47T1]EIK97140.1 lipoprotein [Pseudomonas sp. M47T1]